MNNKFLLGLFIPVVGFSFFQGCMMRTYQDTVYTEKHQNTVTEEELPFYIRQNMAPDATHTVTYDAVTLDNEASRRTTSLLPPSLSKQFHAIRDAADGGNSMAQAQLGDLYFDGQFVEKDLSKAIKWYQLSANNNFAYAQYMLAVLYQEGRFVEQNIQLSSTWFKKANKSPHRVIAERLIADRSMNPTSDFYNKKRALEWYQRAAEKMNMDAQLKLAEYYSQGLTKDSQLAALNWYSKVANSNHNSVAQYNLGLIFSEGLGVKKNPEEAFNWFKKAAMQRFGAAQYHLAKLYENGIGTKKDRVLAYAWYRLAARDLAKDDELNKPALDAIKKMNTLLTPGELERAGEVGWQLQATFSESQSVMQGR